MLARVYVTLKPGVSGVRLGKYIEVQLPDGSGPEARAQVEEMCRKLLANTVVENFRVEIG